MIEAPLYLLYPLYQVYPLYPLYLLYLLYPSIDAVEGLCVFVAPALRLTACAGGCDRMAVWGLLDFDGGRMEVTLWQGCAIGTIYVNLRLVASKNEISKDVIK